MDMIQNVAQDLIALMAFLKGKMGFTNLLVWIGALGLAGQAFVGLSFFISSIWEKEKRAGLLAAFQFIGMAMLSLKIHPHGCRPQGIQWVPPVETGR